MPRDTNFTPAEAAVFDGPGFYLKAERAAAEVLRGYYEGMDDEGITQTMLDNDLENIKWGLAQWMDAYLVSRGLVPPEEGGS